MKQFLPLLLCLVTILVCYSYLFAWIQSLKSSVTNFTNNTPIEVPDIFLKVSNRLTATGVKKEFAGNFQRANIVVEIDHLINEGKEEKNDGADCVTNRKMLFVIVVSLTCAVVLPAAILFAGQDPANVVLRLCFK